MPNSIAPLALVVDDDVLIRMDAADILADAGFTTQEAGDVVEAIEILDAISGDVQLLFTDVQMPGDGDRFDLARDCATRWPHISIIVASGHVKPEPDCMPDTATFVTKPFSGEIVRQHLIDLLRDDQKPLPLRRIEQDAAKL